MQQRLARSALLACALCAAAPKSIVAAQPREVSNTLARHYGYLIGERFTQQVRVAAPASHTLERSALPKAGRANRLLELRALDIREREAGGERFYDLRLHYQVMANDELIGVTALPRPVLVFDHGAQRSKLRLGEQHISVSPLTDADAWHHAGLRALRPEHGTPLLNTLATQQRMAAYALMLGALALYWLYRIYGVPFWARSRGPFYRAWRALRAARSAETDSLQGALRNLHRAFDETFGASVLRPQIGAFLERHPRYASLREPIERFFEFSRRQFYAGQAGSGPQRDGQAAQLSEQDATTAQLSKLQTTAAQLSELDTTTAQLSELRVLARRLSLLERQLQ